MTFGRLVAHFGPTVADFLRSLGFSATRYDRDVWMRAREEGDGYDYICTHVDDFKIVARDPNRWKLHISAAFLLKSIGPPSAYYLGNDYNFLADERRVGLKLCYVLEGVHSTCIESDDRASSAGRHSLHTLYSPAGRLPP